MNSNDGVNNKISISKFISTDPPILSKSFSLDADGILQKSVSASMTAGTVETIPLTGINELAALLTALTPSNALSYGLSEHTKARVVTKKMLSKIQRNGGDPIIARTKDYFRFAPHSGVFMLDADFPDGKGMAQEAYLETLYSIVPELRECQHLLAHSASSHIYHADKCMKGASGFRVLIPVQNATDIPRAGKVLFMRLFMAGHGFIFITKSGAMLPRTLIDASVFQAERLDFCGGANCQPPLEQRRPAPVVFNSDGLFLDTEKALPNLTAKEEKEYLHAVTAMKKATEPEANETRDAWVDRNVERLAADGTPEEKEKIKETLNLAAHHKKLLSDFPLTLEGGGDVSVFDLLSHKDKYHGMRCLDPLEPDYNGGRFVGWINTNAARPYIFSHAHGGQRFTLYLARTLLRLADGERFKIVKATLETLTLNGQHYNRGGELVSVMPDGSISPRDQQGMQFDCDGILKFEKYDKRSEAWVPKDCPPNLASGIMAATGLWTFPKLSGVVTAPILDPRTDRLIDSDGFDADSGLLLLLSDVEWPGIPDKPTDLQVEDALHRLWIPFEKFPFDSNLSKGVHLACVLTSVIRPLLNTAPGFAYDSPIAGSGKTKLCKSVAAYSGEEPALLASSNDSEEIRKKILPVLRTGKKVLVFDNISGAFESDALCVLLTCSTYQDRILGQSENVSIPTQVLVLVSGNNIALKGDLCRRILKCRIDPGTSEPWKRSFALDPVEYCIENRIKMIADALTIIRAGIQRGPRMRDRTASFELWSDTVRRSVCLVRNLDLMSVEDPVEAIDAAYSLDPETSKLYALMSAWRDTFGDQRVKVAELIRKATDTVSSGFDFNPINADLFDAVTEIAGEGRSVNSRRLGRWIEKNRGRIVHGLKIVDAGTQDNVRAWIVRN